VSRGGARKGAGRPPKALTDRTAWKGRVAVRITPETAALAQRLMLYEWPGVANVNDLFEYALRRLAETTDD
jgi:hypothetical protein